MSKTIKLPNYTEFVPSTPTTYFTREPVNTELTMPKALVLVGLMGTVGLVAIAAAHAKLREAQYRRMYGPWYAPLVDKLANKYIK